MNQSAAVQYNEDGLRSPEAVEDLLLRLDRSMEGLLEILEEETGLLRNGKLRLAGDLQPRKTEAAEEYSQLMHVAKENLVAIGNLAPNLAQRVKDKHAMFRDVLRINLSALAIAREVSEDIVRTVAKTVGAPQGPRTYGPGAAEPSAGGSLNGISFNQTL
ncbi:MAG: flagellar protein FlgN [Stappiaceae bacterium]